MIVSFTELFNNLQTMFDLKYYNEVCRLVNAMIDVQHFSQKIKESLSAYGSFNLKCYRDEIQKEDEFNTKYIGLLNIHKKYVNWYFQTPKTLNSLSP